MLLVIGHQVVLERVTRLYGRLLGSPLRRMGSRSAVNFLIVSSPGRLWSVLVYSPLGEIVLEEKGNAVYLLIVPWKVVLEGVVWVHGGLCPEEVSPADVELVYGGHVLAAQSKVPDLEKQREMRN